MSGGNVGNFLGLGESGDGRAAALPHGDVLEDSVFLAVSEVEVGRHVEIRDIDAGGGVPDGDELFGVGIGEGLEQDAFDHAEDGGIGADAQRQGEQRDGGKNGGMGETAEGLA